MMEIYFSQFWRLGSPRWSFQVVLYLVKMVFKDNPFCVSHEVGWMDERSSTPLKLHRRTRIFHKGSVLLTYHLLRAPPPNNFTLRVKTNVWHLKRTYVLPSQSKLIAFLHNPKIPKELKSSTPFASGPLTISIQLKISFRHECEDEKDTANNGFFELILSFL